MHPFVKILSFILILLLMNFMSYESVWLLCIFACMFAAKLQFKNFLRVVRRMRWLFISIFIIYAYGTPGEYVQHFPVNFAPTFEGFSLGLLQIAKLLIAVASLSILFATSSKEHLMAGLYMLLSPLSLIGLNVQRFTARLLLTLDYVEELAIKDSFKLSFHHLDELHSATESLQADKVIVLQRPPFKRLDKFIIVIILSSLLILIAPKFLVLIKSVIATKLLS